MSLYMIILNIKLDIIKLKDFSIEFILGNEYKFMSNSDRVYIKRLFLQVEILKI